MILITFFCPIVDDHGSTTIINVFRLQYDTSNNINSPNKVKELLVSRIIIKIATLIFYEHNLLLRLVLHLICLIN